MIVGAGTAWAEEETIASFSHSSIEGWTITNAEYATTSGGYYKLISSDASIVSPSINWTNYSDITITISARKYGGPNATQGKISVSQGETELASYSPSETSIVASSALKISPVDGSITISCPGASSSKGCGVQSIVIKGTKNTVPVDPNLEENNLALSPTALTFDLYNNKAAKVINYTTSSTGAVTVSESDYVSTVVNQSAKTITVTPLEKTAETVEITVSQAADETYAAGSATFTVDITDSTPIPTHQVTFSINGVTSSNEVEEGADIVFPDDPSDISGKTFMGWTTEAINGTADEAPEFVTSAVMGQNDVTFYAVFATVEESGNSLQKMQSGDTFVAGDKIVVVAVDGNNKYGMYQETQSNSYVKYYLFSEDYNTIILDDKNWWTVSSGSDGKWKLGDSTNGYLYNSSSNNLSVDKSNATEWTLEDNGNGTFSLKSSRYLSCRTDLSGSNTNLYRMAGSTPAGIYSFSIYKLSDGISYSEYCTTVVAAAVEKPVIKVAENPFLFSTTATITCATYGATIKYSFDGKNWNDYSEALTITATTTIHAKATKGNDESNIATAIVTKNLAEPTVAISGDLTLDLNGETDVPAGTLTAAVTYNETAVDGATVTWSGNNAAVATINAETGAVTIKSRGTVTFTATYAGNDDFAEATATKTITVTDSKVPGTKNNPYTVAQAIEAIDNSVGVTGVYATGIVSKIVTAYNSQYGNISYNISVDGTTEKAQLQAYRGKSYNGENFTSEDDIQVGDVVVIYGNLKKYNSTYEFEQDNQLVSRTENSASDLTKKGDITLDFKNGNTVATLTDYFTTSSTGAITYTVADETVIENADELISALKVGTTTVTVSQAATLSYKAGEITINVTVQDTREAATTIPAINIETLKVDDVGTLSVTNPVKADEGVTFSFASSDDNVLMVENGEYAALAVGTVTVTVTATPSNTNLYKPVVANFEVTVEADVKTNTEIAIDDASGSTVYGTPKNVDFVITDGYNGELSYTIDNAAIADVEIGASAITFTPKAVGIAVITISAPETATFNAAENVQYTLTVTAPEGSTEAAVSSVILFNETFDKCEGSGGRDGEFTGNVGTSSTTGNLDEEWTTIGSNGASQCIKLGTGKATGSVETSNITLSGSATLTFSAAGWGDTSTNTIQVSAEGATLSGDVEVTLANGVWNSYTVNITEATGSVSITFTMKRGFLDDVVVTKEDAAITAKLNASGYATFCSQYPLDFTTTNGYTAWQIKAISGETITFEKITGAIKGGQGILLKGEADATVTLASKDASTMLDGNLLYGTTAPTYVTDDEYFGLSGNKFVKINAGTVPAGKALLPASAIPAGARELTFVFEDGQTTGIESLNPALSKGADTIYDLQGRKVAQPTKGLYIKNGKKVVMK